MDGLSGLTAFEQKWMGSLNALPEVPLGSSLVMISVVPLKFVPEDNVTSSHSSVAVQTPARHLYLSKRSENFDYVAINLNRPCTWTRFTSSRTRAQHHQLEHTTRKCL
ncbi:hypothetical protein QAD02_022812 [Eretmocerus hayati]|uniref:Uncharacterized protein n=1 Tax=Eretmocerus hayati TaxID=131215 RepID=A0ACC2PV80_9HYME|nr:hypothetical protein QAD02_022812 [Eretmocerus hayati]